MCKAARFIVESVVYETGSVKVREAEAFVPGNTGKSDIVLRRGAAGATRVTAWSWCLAVGSVAVASALWGCAPLSGPDAGWTTLIDGGAGLSNWNRVGDANWRAEGGTVVADEGKGGYLVSKGSYRDFHVRAEFWAEPHTNSGVFVRLSDPARISSKSGYEVNIYDQASKPAYGTGAIVNVAPVSVMPKAGGKWNTYEITAEGSRLVVVLNGVRTVDVRHGQFTQGPIALQYRTGPIKWRKVMVRKLGSHP